jgi:hypothetical protein
MRAPALSLALLVLGRNATRTAAAQQQPTAIPTELALALIDNSTSAYGSRPSRITVGQAPLGMPASLASADGAVVLGGIEFPERATVVLSFTLPANQVRAALDKQLVARGWAAPSPNERGGFVPGDYSSLWGLVYCADSSVAMISYLPAPAGGTYVRIQHIRNNARTACNPQRYAPMDRMRSLKFPTLRPPIGVEQRGAESGFASGRVEISSRLVGAGEALDVLTHYMKQLESAGWKMGGPITADGTAVAAASTKDSNGVDWNGAITVIRLTPSEVEVTIHMLRPFDR